MASGGEVAGQLADSGGSEDLEDLKCTPCHEDGELREAVGLCVDCQEYLCQRCFDSHTVPKPMRHHQLLNKQNMMQSQIQLNRKDKCTERCSQHGDEVIKYYCTGHCQLGCSVCLNLDHRTCKGILYIPDIAKDLAANEEYKQVEYQLRSSLEKSKKVTEVVRQYSETTECTYNEAIAMVKNLRKKLNEALDKVETEIVNQATGMKSAEMNHLVQITEKCKRVQTELQTTLVKIEAFQNSKQHCNMFTEMMKLKSKLKSLDNEISDAQRELSATKCEIKFTPSQDMLNTLEQREAFGRLSITNTTQNTEILDTKKQSEAIERPPVTDKRSVVSANHDQDVDVKTEIDTKSCWITGSVVLHDNRLVITDCSNKSIKAMDTKQGQIITKLILSSFPWDIAKISNNQVAVTLPSEGKVAFVQAADSMSVDRALFVGAACRGVDYRDHKLAVSYIPDQVKVLDLQGTVLHSITNRQGQSILNDPYFLTFGLDSSTMYVSNYRSNNLVCMKLDGTVVATYTDDDLSCPRKVVVDNSGKVYLCSLKTHNIQQLTPDCRKIRVLLTKADGLLNPFTVTYNDTENKLYVGMRDNNNVKVYKAVLGTD